MLITKIHIPPSSSHMVHRPDLHEKLNEGLNRKLILVSAPAGFGKTTAVSDWIRQQALPAAWYSMDAGDNDPAIFLHYVIAGIQTLHPQVGQSALRLLQSPNHPAVESIASLLINEMLDLDPQFLLVLDDYHVIRNQEVENLVAFLLAHIPANTHLVILTRSDPALSLARLRSQQQLVEIRAADLSFSAPDIAVLFNKKLKLELSPDDVHALEAKTEGWIAGLQLTALSMQGRSDPSGFIRHLKGDNRYIMDYLMEEVLRALTDEHREFLLCTSILEQMSAPLCDVLLKHTNSLQVLETLERNNMFLVPLDDDRNWYRYHHLFAELLKQRLHQEKREYVAALHDTASDWFQQHAMPVLAIEHALKAGNHEKAIRFLGAHAEAMWLKGQHAALLKYGDALPEEIILLRADFCVYYAWILLIGGQVQKAEPLLTRAEETTRRILNAGAIPKTEAACHKSLLGKISVAFAYLNTLLARTGKIADYSKTAMEFLSPEDPLWYSWALYSKGLAEMFRENFNECLQAFKEALTYAKQSGNIYLISTIGSRMSALEARMGQYSASYRNCTDLIRFMHESGYAEIARSESTFAGLYAYMAGVEGMRTDFGDALVNINRAYELCKNESDYTFKVNMFVIYTLILFGRGDMDGAVSMLHEADEILKRHVIFPGSMAMYVAMKGYMLIIQHEPEQAERFFHEKGPRVDKEITYSEEFGYSPFVLLLVLNGKFTDAENLLSRLLEKAQAGNRMERVIEFKVLSAVLHHATGNREKAMTCLMEALADASRDHILMPFVLYHFWIQDLLKDVYRIQATTKTSIPRAVTEKLRLALDLREKSLKTQAQSGISERELEMLRLLAANLTNQEMAERLFISLNTVKTHLKNIYLKLDAGSRTEALTKAKSMGLI